MSKVLGYCRVSSKGQLDNNSFEAQEKIILDKYSNAIISREQYTGTKTDRPVFNEVLKQLEKGDVLVVSKLDRLARNTKEGITIVEDLFERGISVHVCNIGLLENTTMGKFFLQTMLAVAEMERNMIIERTQEGKAIAKTKNGFKEGRPQKYTQTQLDHAMDLLKEYSYTQVEKMTKISKSTLTREARKRKNS